MFAGGWEGDIKLAKELLEKAKEEDPGAFLYLTEEPDFCLIFQSCKFFSDNSHHFLQVSSWCDSLVNLFKNFRNINSLII